VSGIVYGFLWVLTRVVGRMCFRYRVEGHVPRSGGFLIAANHASYLDIPLLGCGMRRRAWYLGRNDLFPIPVLNSILQSLGWIPVRLGRLDREAFAKAISLIRAGHVVVIFPEGGRTQDGHLRPPKAGIGVIVSQTGCPVVVNTSFNVRGEPIVCTPEDAFRCFMQTDIEVLAIGDCLLRKEEQDASLAATFRQEFEPD